MTIRFTKMGYFLAIASALSYGVMSFLVHINPSSYAPEQLVFYRSIISIICLFPFCFRDLGKYFERHSKAKMLWVRATCGAAAILCYYYALQGTASANANLLFSCSPLFVSIFSWLLFSEKINKFEVGGIFLIILGNIFLYIPNQNPIPFWVGIVGTLGALLASISFLSLGQAAKQYSSSMIVFGFSLMSLLFAKFYGSYFSNTDWQTFHFTDALYIFTTSLLGLLSQVLATLSFAQLKSSVATAIGRSSIIFSGILDITVGKYLPSGWELLSYFTVILGIYIIHDRKTKYPADAK